MPFVPGVRWGENRSDGLTEVMPEIALPWVTGRTDEHARRRPGQGGSATAFHNEPRNGLSSRLQTGKRL